MSIPSSILNLFSDSYDGFAAAKFKSANEAHNVEVALKEAKLSYQTKIKKSKKSGREFIVMLVSPA